MRDGVLQRRGNPQRVKKEGRSPPAVPSAEETLKGLKEEGRFKVTLQVTVF